MKRFIVSSITSVLVFVGGVERALAVAGGTANDADNALDALGQRAGVGDSTVEGVVGTGIGIVLSFVGLIFLVLMVYAGVLWITARGEEGQVDKARKIIVSTVIGLVVVISAYAITYFVTSQFVG